MACSETMRNGPSEQVIFIQSSLTMDIEWQDVPAGCPVACMEVATYYKSFNILFPYMSRGK